MKKMTFATAALFGIGSTAQFTYSDAQARIAATISAGTYCYQSMLPSLELLGPAQGFVVTQVISNPTYDVQGFIGYLPSDSSIYVAFRGSTDINGWYRTLQGKLSAYRTYPECNCQVNVSIQLAADSVSQMVITEVKRLEAIFPGHAIKVTGHSLGAGIA